MSLDIILLANHPDSALRFIDGKASTQKGTTSYDKTLVYFKTRKIDEVYLEFDYKVLELYKEFTNQLDLQCPIIENYLPEGNQKIRTDAEQVIILCPEQDGSKAYILKIKKQ